MAMVVLLLVLLMMMMMMMMMMLMMMQGIVLQRQRREDKRACARGSFGMTVRAEAERKNTIAELHSVQLLVRIETKAILGPIRERRGFCPPHRSGTNAGSEESRTTSKTSKAERPEEATYRSLAR